MSSDSAPLMLVPIPQVPVSPLRALDVCLGLLVDLPWHTLVSFVRIEVILLDVTMRVAARRIWVNFN